MDAPNLSISTEAAHRLHQAIVAAELSPAQSDRLRQRAQEVVNHLFLFELELILTKNAHEGPPREHLLTEKAKA